MRQSPKLTLILSAALVFVLLLARTVSAQGYGTLRSCPAWRQVYSGTRMDAGGWITPLSADQLTQIESWRAAVDFWKPLGSYGTWNMPSDVQQAAKLTLNTASGVHYEFVMVSASEPQSAWVWAFNDLHANADKNGNHFGIHDMYSGVGGHYVLPISDIQGIVSPQG